MLGPLKSIRSRLTLWYSFVLITTLLAFGVIAYTYSSRQLLSNLDRSLSNEVRWVKTFIQPKAGKVKPSRKFQSKKHQLPVVTDQVTPVDVEADVQTADDEIWNQIYEHALLNPKKTLIEVTDTTGAIIFRSFSLASESLMVSRGPLDSLTLMTVKSDRGGEWRVAATATKELRIYAAYPLAELSDVLDNLFSILLVLTPIALTVSIGGGLFLANKSLRPVDDITKAARQITAQKLDQQIPYRNVDDEIGRLVLTINEMITRLGVSFQQIQQFSSDVSHELRTPLAVMRGEVELALRTPRESTEYRRVLASNLEEILRLSSIIDNLLTLTKGEMGKQGIQTQQISLSDLLEDLAEDAQVLAEKKHQHVELVINRKVVVLGDALRLRQLLLNLIDNAVKYTQEGGTIKISAGQHAHFVVVSVTDNGFGIPLEDQTRIFDRFYRVDKARSRELGGSGLGLAIAKWIAEQHHGKIEIESELHKGSTFSVYLPL